MTKTKLSQSYGRRRASRSLFVAAATWGCGGITAPSADEPGGGASTDLSSETGVGGETSVGLVARGGMVGQATSVARGGAPQVLNAVGGTIVVVAVGGWPQGGGAPDIADPRCADGGWAVAQDPLLPVAPAPDLLDLCSGRAAGCLPSRHEGCRAALRVTSVATADLNGDGFLDLVSGGIDGKVISLFAGRGDGTFGEAVSIPVGRDPMTVVLADVNLDGNTDIVAANSADATWSILLGDGKGSFALSSLLSPTGTSLGVGSTLVADFDRDGRPDLVGENLGSSTVQLFSGQGDGTFGAPKTLPMVASGPLATGDINSDMIPDLVGLDGLGRLVVLLGNGDGTFSSSVSGATSASGGTTALVLADLDRDQRLDLAALGRSWSIGVSMGSDTGTFTSFGISLPTGAVPVGLITTDLNADGWLDVVTTNSSSETLSVFFGSASGPNPSSVDYVAGITPRGVAAGDFDRDGKPDLAVANYSLDNYFTVLFGVTGANCQK